VARGQPHVRSLPMGQWKNPRRGDRPRRGLFKEFVTDLEPRVRRRGAEPCSAGIDQAVPQRRASRRDQLSRARQRAEASQSESTSLKSKQVRPSVRVGQARRRERHRSPQKAKWRRGGAQAKRVDEAKQRRSQVREAKPSQRSQAKSEKPSQVREAKRERSPAGGSKSRGAGQGSGQGEGKEWAARVSFRHRVGEQSLVRKSGRFSKLSELLELWTAAGPRVTPPCRRSDVSVAPSWQSVSEDHDIAVAVGRAARPKRDGAQRR
jgi:hypothetical protein